jgi:hypothetical protein
LESPWLGYVHRDFVVPTLAAMANKILQLRASSYVFTEHL